MTDILILGGGPAGLTAALYAARAGKSVVVCEKESFGGQITQAHQVDNYPGLPGISGMDLGDKLCAQAMDAGVQTVFCEVVSIHWHIDGTFYVETDDGPMNAKAVIFAGGAKPRMLGVEREEDLIGSGVSYCALCDGAFFQGQDVAIVGGGNTAFSDALVLAGICRSVTLIHRRNEFRAENAVVESVKATPNIKLMTPYTIKELLGQDQVEGIVLHDGTTLPVQAVFVALGRVPDCSVIETLIDQDSAGYALSDESCHTKTPGLFVAGDCRSKTVRQLTTAMADGTVAAMAACEWLDRKQ